MPTWWASCTPAVLSEFAKVEELFDHPQHPYTEGLFRSMPAMGKHKERLETIHGTVPNPARFPSGCKFHPRCPRTRDLARQSPAQQTVEIATMEERFAVMKVCTSDEPVLREVRPGHWASCHFAENFATAPTTVPTLQHLRIVQAEATEEPNLVAVAKEEFKQ